MLIFVSEAERYVEILVDEGISNRLDNKNWDAIVAAFTQQVKQGQTLQGFVTCVEACGELLKVHVPVTHVRNELPNRLVVLRLNHQQRRMPCRAGKPPTAASRRDSGIQVLPEPRVRSFDSRSRTQASPAHRSTVREITRAPHPHPP